MKNGKVVIGTNMNELPSACFFCDYFKYDDSYDTGQCFADGIDNTLYNIYDEAQVKRQWFCPLKIVE